MAAALLAPASAWGGVLPKDAFSDKAAGTTGANFLKIPVGARADALGASYVAAVDDVEAVFWNPAGLAGLESGGVSDACFSYYSLLETAYSGSAAFAMPLGRRGGVVAGSFIYASQGAIQGYDESGAAADSFTTRDLAASAAYAKTLGRFRVGSGLKLIRSQVADAAGTTFAVDLGGQLERAATWGDGPVDVGLSLRNLGPAIKVGTIADPLPLKLQAGGLWRISPKLSLLMDLHFPVDRDFYVSGGIEGRFPFSEGFAASLRGGYNVGHERDLDGGQDLEGLAGVSVGAGLDLRRFRMDYAWVPMGVLGSTHRITFGVRFL
ncbi:MAG TPA: hypothetical protein DD417_07245 [Elusimicrobia bacterium]|nr:hypothetical protein [Elusimicrobiota bacterium]